jgi:hypothetical protein
MSGIPQHAAGCAGDGRRGDGRDGHRLRRFLRRWSRGGQAHPRGGHFKEDIIQAFYEGIRHKPHTTFGNIKADVLADKDPHLMPANFCSVIHGFAGRG